MEDGGFAIVFSPPSILRPSVSNIRPRPYFLFFAPAGGDEKSEFFFARARDIPEILSAD